ncbi:hypothetical protein EDB37_10171 [Vibrio crassostreae]|nr:hypothetical protein EDB37_10171 [Vibrio crassostreae]
MRQGLQEDAKRCLTYKHYSSMAALLDSTHTQESTYAHGHCLFKDIACSRTGYIKGS